jgi:hypothetical protein
MTLSRLVMAGGWVEVSVKTCVAVVPRLLEASILKQ